MCSQAFINLAIPKVSFNKQYLKANTEDRIKRETPSFGN